MKKKIGFVITLIVVAAAFFLIYILYGKLKNDYAPDQFAHLQDQTENKVSEDTTDTESRSSVESGTESDFTAPDFTVTDAEGNRVRLSDLRGKPVVVNFWATWCQYCKEEMPEFDKAFQDNPDIRFMMVNVTDGQRETVNTAREYIDKEGYEFPVYFDTTMEATFAYGASGLPMTVFIDKEGQLITYANGMLQPEGLEKGLDLIRQAG